MAVKPIAGMEFSASDIEKAARSGGLLSLELEMTRACNLRCVYCYASAGEAGPGEMSPAEISSAVSQAAGLGARKIVILGGGEPYLYDDLHGLIDYIRSLSLEVELFTNAALIDRDRAGFLYDRGVSVVVKRNAATAAIQDELAGVPGTFARIEAAIGCLMDAGYPDPTHCLGAQTVICSRNLKEIPDLWRWARDRGITPYFESLTTHGRARNNPGLGVSPAEMKEAFVRLCEVDREAYRMNWTPHPPLVGSSCARHRYSILVKANGDFCPCVGVDIRLGNVRGDSLADVIRRHPVVSDLRRIYDTIKGRCRTCRLNGKCYGCRGNAYQVTGDYLASDPCCWVNGDSSGRMEG